MGVPGFSVLIVVAPVTVKTRVEGVANDSVHRYIQGVYEEVRPKLDRQ